MTTFDAQAHRARPALARWLLPLAAGLLAACANTQAPDAGTAARRAGVQPGTVSVTHGDLSRFSNTFGGGGESDAARQAWVDTLGQHLAERAAAALPAGQRLEVEITDVQRAGAFEPWRGPQANNVRIVRDVYPPRIDLTFKRLAADGRVLQSGSRQLRDIDFMARPHRDAGDPLGFEKRLLDDWVDREFGAAR